MELTSLHILLTYQCTLACDHCFVWSSPYQNGSLTSEALVTILEQARDLGTVRSIYFEGGEPFLCYPVLLAGVREAKRQGFKTGVVSNGYWANSVEVALQKLHPFAGQLDNLLVSNDLYHWDRKFADHYRNALDAAQELGIPTGVIEIDSPKSNSEAARVGQLPAGVSGVMYRGRAAENLVDGQAIHPWEGFTHCPHEDLRSPARVHLDPLGYIHLCQGISMGNIFQVPLKEIWATYDPDSHPIAGPILRGGPAELCKVYGLPHKQEYADACHLCYLSRKNLRQQLPEILAPEQVYGQSVSSRSESTGSLLQVGASRRAAGRSPLPRSIV